MLKEYPAFEKLSDQTQSLSPDVKIVNMEIRAPDSNLTWNLNVEEYKEEEEDEAVMVVI